MCSSTPLSVLYLGITWALFTWLNAGITQNVCAPSPIGTEIKDYLPIGAISRLTTVHHI